MNRLDLIIHPVRIRIIEAIGTEALTTQEIADRLPDVPKSSIYRHLKQLLDGEVVRVWDTRLVKGIQEKTYRMGHARLLPADLDGITADQHINYFTTYLMTLLRSFGNYVQSKESLDGGIEFLKDRTGYTEATFYATDDEFDQFQMMINQALMPLISQPEGNGRKKRKLAVITHPILNNKGEHND
ncbi:MAG: helix-turn-helix domain-containing protein [Chloroflexota bacterium]